MGTPTTIRYLSNREIDKDKWDTCVQNAENGLIYGRSNYLDAFAKHWDGLVLGDYEMVMPLVWNRKYSFKYIYQPYFVCQLGIFGTKITAELSDAFLNSIPNKFRYWDIDLPEWNQPGSYKATSYPRVNMLLSLNAPFDRIQENYNRLAGRMLNKAKVHHLKIREDDQLEDCLNFYWREYDSILNLKHTHHEILMNAFRQAKEKEELILLSAFLDDKRCGVYILLRDNKNIYSVLGGGSVKGKQMGAFYALTDYVIKKFASNDLILRFEGSDIKGIANFNASFGAKAVEFLHIQNNLLPLIFRWLKK